MPGDAARGYGKSDPIDALAVARAALREPGLPTARLDGPERELRLLADHREDLVVGRTPLISRLRWHLHELGPGWDPAPPDRLPPAGASLSGSTLGGRQHQARGAARSPACSGAVAGVEWLASRISFANFSRRECHR
jgi:Transposase